MSEEGSPAPPAGSGSVPVAELKALLKDSLVEILRENPSLVRPSEDAGSGSRSGKPHVSVFVMARWCLRVGFFNDPSVPSVGEAQWRAGRWRALPFGGCPVRCL